MTTYSALANQLAYVTSPNSGWTWGVLFQGAYGASYPNVGVMLFADLRSAVAWQDMNVLAVRLWLDFGSAGAVRHKTLGLYTASRSSVSGPGWAMLGPGIGMVLTNTTTWKQDETLFFDPVNNSSAFANLKSWLETGSGTGLALYLNESAPSSGTYSTNYLNVERAGIEIDYEPRGSTGALSPESAETGGAIRLTVDPIQAEGVVTHAAQWRMGGSTSAEIPLAEGVTVCDFTLPTAWLSELAGVTSGPAECLLTTYVDGQARGTRTIPFTVRVPDRYAPVLRGFSVRRYAASTGDGGETVYAESLAGGQVWVSIDAQIDTDGGLNAATASIRHYPAGDESQARTVSVPWQGGRLLLDRDRSVIPGEIPPAQGWVFELTLDNGHGALVAGARVERSWAPVHVAGTGYGVGIGMYAKGTQAKPALQVAWPAYMLGGIAGVSNFSTEEQATGGHWIDGRPLYARTLAVDVRVAGADTLAGIGDDVDAILDFSGALVTDTGCNRPISWNHSATLYCSVFRYQNQNVIGFRAGETGVAYITILYTKRNA